MLYLIIGDIRLLYSFRRNTIAYSTAGTYEGTLRQIRYVDSSTGAVRTLEIDLEQDVDAYIEKFKSKYPTLQDFEVIGLVPKISNGDGTASIGDWADVDPSLLSPDQLADIQSDIDANPDYASNIPQEWYQGDTQYFTAPSDDTGSYIIVDGQKTYFNTDTGTTGTSSPSSSNTGGTTNTSTGTGTDGANGSTQLTADQWAEQQAAALGITTSDPQYTTKIDALKSAYGQANGDSAAAMDLIKNNSAYSMFFPEQGPTQQTGTGTTDGAGSGTADTTASNLDLQGSFGGGGFAYTKFPGLEGDDLLNSIIDSINGQNAAAYEGTDTEVKVHHSFNFLDVFDAEEGTMFDVGIGDSPFTPISGTQMSREDILGNKEFNIAVFGTIFHKSLSQPLENYESLIRAGVQVQDIVVNPLPKQQPLDIQGLNIDEIMNQSQAPAPASAQVQQETTIPNQSVTDITGGSGQ